MSRPLVSGARLLLPLAGVLACASGVRAEDDPAKPALVEVVFDLRDRAPRPGSAGPVLLAPSDRMSPSGEVHQWSHERNDPRTEADASSWVPFDVGADTGGVLEEPIVGMLRQAADQDGVPETEIEAGSGVVRVRGTAEHVAKARERLEWAKRAMAPRARVRARLWSGADRATLAANDLHLVAGAWVRVWLREERPVYPLDWSIEIAQQTTAMHPVLLALSEGQELYLRWLPGETVHLLELWSGDLEHQEEVAIDFTPIRNVPESSGPGPCRLPRTTLRRAYSVAVLRAGESTELAWRLRGDERRLRVELESIEAVAPDQSVKDFQWAALRSGAAGARLLFEARPHASERLLAEAVRAVSDDPEMNVNELDVAHRTLWWVAGQERAVQAARRVLESHEKRLGRAALGLRTWVVPEEALRALPGGSPRLGEPLPAETLAALQRTGAVEGHGVEIPLLAGVTAGFRVGTSVPGLVRVDVEVAQQAGGMDPVMGARFAGLYGEALWLPGEGLGTLRVGATLAWADPKGGTVDLTFRAPVSMDFNKEKQQPESDAFRRVTLPTLQGGAAELDADVAWPAPGERLVALTVRDGEATLLLAKLEVR
jgi:hypothetical protein